MEYTREQYKVWLLGIKTGDLVGIVSRGFNTFIRIGVVNEITPTGIIKVIPNMNKDKEYVFDKYGAERGVSRGRLHLTELTKEVMEGIERIYYIKKLSDFKFSELSLETLREIYTMLGGSPWTPNDGLVKEEYK